MWATRAKRNLLRPAPLLRLVPWLVAGILIEDACGVGWGTWPLGAGVLLTLLVHRWPTVQSVCLGVCLLLMGMQLTQQQKQRILLPQTALGQRVEAVVVSEVKEQPRTMAADLLLVASGRRVKAYFWKDERSIRLKPGDGLQVRVRIESTDGLQLGRFDYGRYLQVNGFSGRCYVGSHDWQLASIAQSRLPRLERLRLRALQWRHRLLQRYRSLAGHEEDSYAILAAMTLGERSSLSRELREVYAQTGTAHVLALSGLHMGILFSLFSMVSFLGRRSMVARLLMVCLFWSFALLTGLSVSVVRSALMLSIVAVFSLRGSRNVTLNVLCFAAIVILVGRPLALFDLGFQLSFLSVFAIIMVLPVLDGLWPAGFLIQHRVIKGVWSVAAVSIAAQLGTAPLVAYCFGQLPVFFVLTNFVVVPCVMAVLWLALAYMLLPLSVVGHALLLVVGLLNDALTTIGAWPHASIGGLHPTLLQTVMAYVLIVAVYLFVVRWRHIRLVL